MTEDDPLYWARTEAAFQEEKRKQLVEQFRRSQRLNEIVQEEIAQIPDQIKATMKPATPPPPETDTSLLEGEYRLKLVTYVRDRALARLEHEERNIATKNEMQQKPSRHILRYMIETTLSEMSIFVATIKQFPLNELLINPSTINGLISTCESWNRDVEQLHAVDLKYKALEITDYPMEKSQRAFLSIWVQNIQANKIFTNTWFDSQRTALRRFLNE